MGAEGSTLWLQVGEVMDGRYEVFATHGKGVFSTVLRARDRGAPSDPAAPPGAVPEVAVKVIRSNDTMFKARVSRSIASSHDAPMRVRNPHLVHRQQILAQPG